MSLPPGPHLMSADIRCARAECCDTDGVLWHGIIGGIDPRCGLCREAREQGHDDEGSLQMVLISRKLPIWLLHDGDVVHGGGMEQHEAVAWPNHIMHVQCPGRRV